MSNLNVLSEMYVESDASDACAVIRGLIVALFLQPLIRCRTSPRFSAFQIHPSTNLASAPSPTDTMVLDRLRLLLCHITGTSPPNSPYPGLSYHVGPTSKPLKHITLHQLLAEQVILNGDCEALVSAWQGIRWTYRELDRLSDELARKFYGLGIRKGDRMGIMAGNCGEYVLVYTILWFVRSVCADGRRFLLVRRLERY